MSSEQSLSLKARFLLVISLIGVISLAFFFVAVDSTTSTIAERWALQIVEHDARQNQDRAIQPLIEEITFAKRMAQEPVVLDWAKDPDNPNLAAAALNFLNGYKARFSDASYFVTLAGNNAYFHNNAADEFTGDELRYTLDPNNPADGWFYKSIASARATNLNVDHDRGLELTKLWVNVQIRSEGEVLGMIGTGLDLSRFLSVYVDHHDRNFHTLFLDADGAIQLSMEQEQIVNGSVGKDVTQKELIFTYLGSPADKGALEAAMDQTRRQPDAIKVLELDWRGTLNVVGVRHVPTLDWYEITLVDRKAILPVSDFIPLYILGAGTLVFALLLVYLAVHVFVDRPLGILARRIKSLHEGSQLSKDEEQALPGEFAEVRVQLDRFAHTDPLTGLLNRRGMKHRLITAIEFARRNREPLSLLMLDIDHFKQFNDTHGHPAGDEVLKRVASILTHHFQRSVDLVARYGGEEFLVGVTGMHAVDLRARLEVCRAEIRICLQDIEPLRRAGEITVSAGAVTLVPKQDSQLLMPRLIDQADELLYRAKLERDKVCWNEVE